MSKTIKALLAEFFEPEPIESVQSSFQSKITRYYLLGRIDAQIRAFLSKLSKQIPEFSHARKIQNRCLGIDASSSGCARWSVSHCWIERRNSGCSAGVPENSFLKTVYYWHLAILRVGREIPLVETIEMLSDFPQSKG